LILIFDLDGVIYRGDTVVPGAIPTLHRLTTAGHRLFFLTNNSTRSRRDYAEKITAMGFPAEPEQVMTSAYATGLYLRHQGAEGKRVFLIGEHGLAEEMTLAGLIVVPLDSDERADYVVVGLDRFLTFAKLQRAFVEVRGGAAFVATNKDPTYPMEEGKEIPGGGSMVAALEYALGVTPVAIGKPEPYTLEEILRLAAGRPEEAVMIGDRLDTDIRVGRRVGLKTVLPLTGVTTPAVLESAAPEERPDFVIDSLEELPGIVARLSSLADCV
jgi:phosphoglycolate/pyridoxal phosphate phosphatase family enzyme